jgi:hypothetical protein
MRVLSWDVAVKSLAYCILDHTPTTTTVCAWETINACAEAGAMGKTTVKDDAEAVLDALARRRDIFWGAVPDVVIVECQPGSLNNRFSNMKMKVVSHAIHAFFYTVQKLPGMGMGEHGAVVPVAFVSPNSKLAGMDQETPEARTARQQGDRKAMGAKYRANKQYAVTTTASMLATMDPALPTTITARAIFDAAAPKQDDLADAFMLAYAFITKASSGARKRKTTM